MDQWSAKAINVIFGRRVVPIYGDGFGANLRPEHYEEFCNSVDRVAFEIGSTGGVAEEYLFDGRGPGRPRGPWRSYVRAKTTRLKIPTAPPQSPLP